jgi:hypothetical protein
MIIAYALNVLNVQIVVQWTQNNWQLRKRHSKRGKKMEIARGEHDGQHSEHV